MWAWGEGFVSFLLFYPRCVKAVILSEKLAALDLGPINRGTGA